MPYSNTYPPISNARVKSRYQQLIALIGAIAIGMLISVVMNAIPSKVAPSANTNSSAQR